MSVCGETVIPTAEAPPAVQKIGWNDEAIYIGKKFGIKPGMTVLVRNAPGDFTALLGELPAGVKLRMESAAKVDCVIAFVRCKADVQAHAKATLGAVIDDGLVWFAYPKKSGPMKTDISRHSEGEPVSDSGFESVVQISIDHTWTGFRFWPKRLVKSRSR